MKTVPGVRYFDPVLECADREVLERHQFDRFSSMARQIWPTNTFYRKKWMAAGLKGPTDLKTWDDFYKLPFLTKDELMVDQAVNPPFGTNMTFPARDYVRLHQTSGTTGKPLRLLDTKESWDWWARCWSHVLYGAGVTPADRIFFAFSFGPFVGFWSAHAAARSIGALAITAGGLDSVTRLKTIQQVQPTVFLSTPSYALHLAEVAHAHGVNLAESSVRINIHAGEPGANIPATKHRIEELWGAQVFDHTGSTEVGANGFACIAQEGTHLIESEYIVEVIDPDTGKHVAEGETGEMVITNLGRIGMPLVRYRTRDLVRLSKDRCGCGRTFARMLGGIIGRSDDMITVRGINIFPSAIENIIREYPEVAEFQIELYQVMAMNELRLRVEPVPGTDWADLSERLAAALRARLALRIEVVDAPEGSLPRYAMKAKRLVRI